MSIGNNKVDLKLIWKESVRKLEKREKVLKKNYSITLRTKQLALPAFFLMALFSFCIRFCPFCSLLPRLHPLLVYVSSSVDLKK